jgi:hypothetical protein
MPIQSTLPPAMGTTCGRREREADAGNEEEQFSNVLVVATVEGTPIHGMPVAFAGGRKSVGLGRSVMSAAGLVPMQAVAPTTTGVLWNKEEGNVVSVRQAHALVAVDAEQAPPRMRTRPSLSPETRARLSPLNSQRESVGTVVRSVRYRGRANLRKQEEPAPGSERTDGKRGSPRVTACRGNSGRSCVTRQKRKVVMAIVPARKRESRIGVRTSW